MSVLVGEICAKQLLDLLAYLTTAEVTVHHIDLIVLIICQNVYNNHLHCCYVKNDPMFCEKYPLVDVYLIGLNLMKLVHSILSCCIVP